MAAPGEVGHVVVAAALFGDVDAGGAVEQGEVVAGDGEVEVGAVVGLDDVRIGGLAQHRGRAGDLIVTGAGAAADRGIALDQDG